GFIAEDVKAHSGRVRGIERRRGGADVDEREPAGVAVGEDACAVPDEGTSVLADLPAMKDVFLRELLGGGEGDLLPFRNRASRRGAVANEAEGVERIHGRRARGGERLEDLVGQRLERRGIGAVVAPQALGETVGRGGADGAGAANHHVADGPGGLAEVTRPDDLESVGQQALLDEPDLIAVRVEGDGAEVARASGDGDLHWVSFDQTNVGVNAGRTDRTAGAIGASHSARRRSRSGSVAGSASIAESTRLCCVLLAYWARPWWRGSEKMARSSPKTTTWEPMAS